MTEPQPSGPPTVTKPEDKVPVHQKVIYGLGTANDVWGNWLYPSMAWPVFNILLHVSPGLVSTALLINRLVDAVTDPLFGWLSTNYTNITPSPFTTLLNPPPMNHYLGIDIGGTKCAVCIGDENADVLGKRRVPTGDGPDATLALLYRHTQDLLDAHGPVEAIGIVCGGPLDADQGLVLSPPNLPGWDEVPIVAQFQDRFGIPAFLQNDANAGALAEWKHGAGRGTRNMMFCTMGTGFGCGLVLDGKLYEGTNGNAGEIGHIRLTPGGPIGYGKAGSVEGYCGGSGIAQVAQLRLDAHIEQGGASLLTDAATLSAKTVAEAAGQGDALAQAIYTETGEMLGRALSMAVDLLNVERIVIGSIFVRAEALLRPAMERVMQAECLSHALKVCTVRGAELGERIGDVAALTVAQVRSTF